MGKFSDYVGTIKNQTDSLREVVSAKSGVDCSRYSIGECAGVVEDLEVTSQEEVRYVRPSWYPDIEDIVMNAPDIVKDGVTYYPCYIILFNDTQTSTAFYKNNSTTSGSINYYLGTGVDAYIFSDTINNDINNANENTLQVGTEIIHTWDFDNFINNNDSIERLAWVVAYKSSVTSIKMIARFYNCIEFVLKRGAYTAVFGESNSSTGNNSLKYIKICKDCKLGKSGTSLASGAFSNLYALEEIVNYGEIYATSYSFNNLYNLKRITNNGTIIFVNTSSVFNPCYSIKELIINDKFVLPLASTYGSFYGLETLIYNTDVVSFVPGSSYGLKKLELNNVKRIENSNLGNYAYGLKYVKIPSTLEFWTTSSSTLSSCKYIELFNDFNISGVNLSSRKYIQWLKNLCGWLKDRTGEEAGTMIIGTENLGNANNIYLTFNPNDKRDIIFDGVTAETEGAVSIVDFITNQLNWTLS